MRRVQSSGRAPAVAGLIEQSRGCLVRGDLDRALALGRRAVEVAPNDVAALCLLGEVLMRKGDPAAALAVCDDALAMRPGAGPLHEQRGACLWTLGRFAEAGAAFRRTVELEPANARAHSSLGSALERTDDLDGAIRACRRGTELDPGSAYAHATLGMVLRRAGQLDAALEAYRTAIRLDPHNAEAHRNASLIMLLQGDFENGWRTYAWRWKSPGFEGHLDRFAGPLWDGRPLEGRTILLAGEQGFGDTFQFIRYAPMVAARGGRVVVEVRAPAAGLVKSVRGVAEVVARGRPLPPYDVFAPLMHLPAVFGTTPATIPAAVPYLSVPVLLRGVLPPRRGKALRVGLVWAGNPHFPDDRWRSFTPDVYRCLTAVEGVELYSLQVGPQAAMLHAAGLAPAIHDLGPTLVSFEATAATLRDLDLLVTSDTSVAHLAGALARPVWVLLPSVPDWRWLLEREDCPWYPTMRLFRQRSSGDWAAVAGRVADELRALAAAACR